ncbi:MAG: hypothetical protein ACK5KO_04440 [Arachnia sp.]
MSLDRFFGALGRQWLTLVLGLMATVGLVYGAWSLVPPTYTASASILLLPPDSIVPEEGNPYLQLGGLGETVGVIGSSLSDQSTRLYFEAKSQDLHYEALQDFRYSSPILTINVEDPSQSLVLETLDELVAMASQRLATMQDTIGITGRNEVTSIVLSQDATPEISRARQLRAMVAAAAAGLILALALVALIDGARQRRAQRRQLAEAKRAHPEIIEDEFFGDDGPAVEDDPAIEYAEQHLGDGSIAAGSGSEPADPGADQAGTG